MAAQKVVEELFAVAATLFETLAPMIVCRAHADCPYEADIRAVALLETLNTDLL